MVTGLAVAMWFAPPRLAIFHHAALQVSKPAQNIQLTFARSPQWHQAWIQGLSGRLAGCKTLSEDMWLNFLRCLFFLQLALYPVNSALLVDSAHPSFCVPSSFHWLDLQRLLDIQMVSDSCWNLSGHLRHWLNPHYTRPSWGWAAV